jgi:hypothetical protein
VIASQVACMLLGTDCDPVLLGMRDLGSGHTIIDSAIHAEATCPGR